MPRKYLIVLFFLAFVGARHAVPLQGLVFADVPLSQQADPCPPECVTDSMEIVTWYPSPYNEYEELRLYPVQRDDNYCTNDKIGLMYYDDGGTPSFGDDDKIRVCKGTLLGWQEVGRGSWEVSGNNIYNTNSGSVGIGTINPNPAMKLHVYDSEKAEIRLQSGGANSYARLAFQTDDGDLWRAGMDGSGNFTFTGFSGTWGDRMTITTSGSVGIGTTSPGQKLEIKGGAGENTNIKLIKNVDTTEANILYKNATNDLWAVGTRASDNNYTIWDTVLGVPAVTVKSNSGNVGIGTASPQSALDVNGGIRTKQGYGAIQQTSNSVPFSSSYVNSHDGETHIWVASTPDLKDGSYCGSGPYAGHRFFDRFSVKGQYIVTLHNDAGTAKIHGQWAGGRVGIKRPDGSDLTDGTGSVNFTIFWDGSSWRLDNMVGSVGNEPISCF